MKKTILFALAAVLALAVAAPAFAATGADGAGLDFGVHHSTHAIEMDGFTAGENPGKHQGFSNWPPVE